MPFPRITPTIEHQITNSPLLQDENLDTWKVAGSAVLAETVIGELTNIYGLLKALAIQVDFLAEQAGV